MKELDINVLVKILNSIVKLPYETISLKQVFNESLFFSVKCKNNKTVHIEKYLDNQKNWNEELHYVIYNDNNPIGNGESSVDQLSEKIKEVIYERK